MEENIEKLAQYNLGTLRLSNGEPIKLGIAFPVEQEWECLYMAKNSVLAISSFCWSCLWKIVPHTEGPAGPHVSTSPVPLGNRRTLRHQVGLSSQSSGGRLLNSFPSRYWSCRKTECQG